MICNLYFSWNTLCRTRVTLKRGTPKNHDLAAQPGCLIDTSRTQSLSPSRSSVDTANSVSVSQKPRLEQSKPSLVSSGSVCRLSAYRGRTKRFASADVQSMKKHGDTKCTLDVPLLKSSASSDEPLKNDSGINSDRLESVLKPATSVHSTRRSLKRGVFVDMVSFRLRKRLLNSGSGF